MQIGIDASFIVRDRRGMGRYVCGMLNALFKKEYIEHEFIIICRDGERETVSRLIESLGAGSNVDVHESMEVMTALWTDVIWYPWNRVDFVPPNGRVAVTVHDVAPFCMKSGGFLKFVDRKAIRRMKKALRASDAVITISEWSASEIRKYLPEAGDPFVVYPGISPLFTQDTCEERGEWPEDFLLFVGADDDRKNIGVMLSGYSIARDDYGVRSKLVICGIDAKSSRRYSGLVGKLGLDGSVIFRGYVSDEELRTAYSKARLFLLPSLYEGFGLPVTEAMACGTPVVCSGTTSLPEVAGDAALFVNPEDPRDIASKISLCLTDDALREEMSRKGLLRAKRFDWDSSARSLISVFSKISEASS